MLRCPLIVMIMNTMQSPIYLALRYKAHDFECSKPRRGFMILDLTFDLNSVYVYCHV
jgi:hypothetical protein